MPNELDSLLGPLPSGRHGLSREQVVHSQRMRLLHAAIAVAGSEGYAAMTVSAVIAQASVSRKTFYELFADREDCFLAVYDLVTQRALGGMRAAYAIEAPWAERLRAAFDWVLNALAEHPDEARVGFLEVLAAGPRALARRDRALHELTALLAPGFDAAPEHAAVPASTPDAIVGALFELIGSRLRNGEAEQLPSLLPDLLFCALAPFVGPVAAAEAAPPRVAAGGMRRGDG